MQCYVSLLVGERQEYICFAFVSKGIRPLEFILENISDETYEAGNLLVSHVALRSV